MNYDNRNGRTVKPHSGSERPETVLGYPLVNVLLQKIANELFHDAENFAPLHVFKGYLLLADEVETLRKLVLTDSHDLELIATKLQTIAVIASKALLDGVVAPATGVDPFKLSPMCVCCGKAIPRLDLLDVVEDDDFDH